MMGEKCSVEAPFINGNIPKPKTVSKETAEQPIRRSTKIISTIFTYTGMAFLGSCINLLGPSLLDLEYLTGSTTKTISPVFNWRYGGYFLGTLLVGPLIDRLDDVLILGVAQGVLGIFTGATPFCQTLVTLFAINTVVGFAQAINAVTMCAILIRMWGNRSDPFQQALHFFVALGGSISPQILKPFLRIPIVTLKQMNNSQLATANTTDMPLYSETKIHYAFCLVGGCLIFGAIFGIALFGSQGCHIVKSTKRKLTKASPGRVLIGGKGKILLLILFVLLAFLHGGMEETFWGMLMTFAVKHLKLSKSMGSDMVTMFWVTTMIARASSIVICRYMKPSVFMGVEISIILIANIVLLLTIDFHWVTPWICIALSGVGVSCILPTIVNWTKGTITLKGKETAAIFSGFGAMKMLSPAFLGYLIEVHTGMWFVYILLVYSALALLVYFTLYGLILFLLKRLKTDSHDIKEKKSLSIQTIGI